MSVPGKFLDVITCSCCLPTIEMVKVFHAWSIIRDISHGFRSEELFISFEIKAVLKPQKWTICSASLGLYIVSLFERFIINPQGIMGVASKVRLFTTRSSVSLDTKILTRSSVSILRCMQSLDIHNVKKEMRTSDIVTSAPSWRSTAVHWKAAR